MGQWMDSEMIVGSLLGYFNHKEKKKEETKGSKYQATYTKSRGKGQKTYTPQAIQAYRAGNHMLSGTQ